ncbi:uncharacterized protein LOC141530737 [Cotesia typhae]|uniref:uncharacterized protein LOC141530737 n=1 Tax=Cotesia typhae TaxID=2053667 RepID=UPI003D681F49
MSRLLLFNIFIIASFFILKVAEGATCDTECVAPAYECKSCPECDIPCGKAYADCSSNCGPPGCGCSDGYCRNPDGDCVQEEN